MQPCLQATPLAFSIDFRHLEPAGMTHCSESLLFYFQVKSPTLSFLSQNMKVPQVNQQKLNVRKCLLVSAFKLKVELVQFH